MRVVAQLNETRKSDSVVGTPYWSEISLSPVTLGCLLTVVFLFLAVAPEIIEMTGQQSSACDIWYACSVAGSNRAVVSAMVLWLQECRVYSD